MRAGRRLSLAERRLVVGSNPTEPTFEAKTPQIPPVFYENAQVLQEQFELLQLRELMHILLGNRGRWNLELRQKTSHPLCESELAFRYHPSRAPMRLMLHLNILC